MTTLFDDPGLGLSGDSSVLQAPGQAAPGAGMSPNVDYGVPPGTTSGIGMAAPVAEQAPAPVRDATPTMTRGGMLQDKISNMSTTQKILSALGEFGAGVQGHASPLQTQIAHEQQQKLQQSQIAHENLSTFTEGMNVLSRLPPGEQRDNFIAHYGSQLGDLQPAFASLGKLPDSQRQLMLNYIPQSRTAKAMADADPSLGRLSAYLASPEGLKQVMSEAESNRLPMITNKVAILGHAVAHYDPSLQAEVAKRGYLTNGDILKVNDLVKADHPDAALNESDLQILQANQGAVYGSLPGFMDAKGQAAVTQKGAEQGKWSDPYPMNGAQVQKNSTTGEIRTAVTRAPTTNVTVQAATNAIKAGAGLSGPEFLAHVEPATAATVRAISEGRQQLTSISTRNGAREAMSNLVNQYNPEFSASDFGTQSGVKKDFTSGVTSRNIVALNQSIGHIGTLNNLMSALKNGDVQTVNSVVNRVAQEFGDPNITNAQTAQLAVGEELMRVFRQVGASEQEAQAWQSKFNPNAAPEQQVGSLKTAASLLDSRISSLNESWNRGMKTKGGYPNILDPHSADVLTQLTGKKYGSGGSDANSSHAVNEHQEGETAVSKSGKPIVFKNGNWAYQ